MYIFKNLRNNWITEQHQVLQFTDSGADYHARWRDLKHLYEEYKLIPVRRTKLTHAAVFPKVFQCQSVPLACQVFNDKTSAVLHTLMSKLSINERTIRFVTLVTKWFAIMNVREKFSALRLRNECRAPWTIDCKSFDKLKNVCDVIESGRWSGKGVWRKKLTKLTANAFVVMTTFNITAAMHFFVVHHFTYLLLAVFVSRSFRKIRWTGQVTLRWKFLHQC